MNNPQINKLLCDLEGNSDTEKQKSRIVLHMTDKNSHGLSASRKIICQ
jgi:hypothetical protein